MKYNIFDFNQEKVISLSKKTIDNGKERTISLDVSDLLILLVISDFVNRKNIIKYTINDKTYFSVQYKVILDDLPILNIKKQALTDRINKMVYLGVIEKEIIKNQTGSYSVFRMGEEYEKIKYSCTDTQLQVRKYSTTSAEVVDYKPKDPSTNNYSTNNKESTYVDKKKTKNEEEITNEDYRKFRLWMKDNCPYCDNPRNFSASTINQEEFLKLKELYTGKEIADVILEIENRKDLRKKYSNLYRTVLNWLRNNNKNNNNGSNNKYSK